MSGLAALALLAGGCSAPAGGDPVFKMTGGYKFSFPIQVDEPGDIGLSVGWLDNTTDAAVHLTGVRFADPPAALHWINTLAYSYKDTHESGIIGNVGILQKECPRFYRPHPLSVVTVPAHANSRWLVVLAFTLSRPGRYHLPTVRIDYTTGGHHGWQYQNINTSVTVKNPPLPGPRPLPPSAVCGGL
jgi:hypothetical protein